MEHLSQKNSALSFLLTLYLADLASSLPVRTPIFPCSYQISPYYHRVKFGMNTEFSNPLNFGLYFWIFPTVTEKVHLGKCLAE